MSIYESDSSKYPASKITGAHLSISLKNGRNFATDTRTFPFMLLRDSSSLTMYFLCVTEDASDIEKIQLFEDQKVRTIWVEGEEKWYFSIKDVVLVLADAKDPKDYLSKMRRREPELAKGWGQIVHPLVVRTPGGPQK